MLICDWCDPEGQAQWAYNAKTKITNRKSKSQSHQTLSRFNAAPPKSLFATIVYSSAPQSLNLTHLTVRKVDPVPAFTLVDFNLESEAQHRLSRVRVTEVED
jgi:hypothetical protein